MKPEDILKMQAVAEKLTREESLKQMPRIAEIIDANMKQIQTQERQEDKFFLEEVPKEAREEIFMVLD